MSELPRKICVVTGTRAEYGLLRWVIQGIKDSDLLELQLIVTGMHLSPEFGLTVKDIEADGFRIDRKVEMLLSSDTSVGVTKSIGLGLIGCADALAELKPDFLLVLGDRFEIFSVVAAALIARIPIAHIHGGELTEGAFDDAIRHSITKMSHFHFVANDVYRNRVIQLGEHPDSVFTVGGLGVDTMSRIKLLKREELEAALDFKFGDRNLLVTFHPVTLENGTSSTQVHELLAALEMLHGTHLIFTMPNADTDSRNLFDTINGFCSLHPNAKLFTSLGQLLYLSCMNQVDGVIGNSSSGLTEAPSFNIGTVNIGDRQKGRLRATSVIDAEPNKESISAAFNRLFSEDFDNSLDSTVNPYGTPGASDLIVHLLENKLKTNSLKKKFYDL